MMFISQWKLTWDIAFSFTSHSLIACHACKLVLIYHFDINSCYKCDEKVNYML